LRGPGGVERIIGRCEGITLTVFAAQDPALTQEAIQGLLWQDRLRLDGRTNELKTLWNGKLVVVGSSATGNDLTDRGATPLKPDTLLVSQHWNVANSILTGRFIRRPPLVVELGLIALLGIVAALLTWKLRSGRVNSLPVGRGLRCVWLRPYVQTCQFRWSCRWVAHC
jgi:CHASE2 domain-containing sensor protein